MTGSLVSDFSIGDANIDNVMLTLDKAYKSFQALSLTEMDSITVPAIAAGSWSDDNGALYKFDTEEAISVTDPVTSVGVINGTAFIYLIPAGATITAAFSAAVPTFSDSKQGWYSSTVSGGNARAVARCHKYYDGYSTYYSAKQILNNETKDLRTPFSPDKVWSIQKSPELSSWFFVCWSPELSLFCAISQSGTDRVMTSPDGITWTGRTAAEANVWKGICWSPELSLFCAVATSGTSRVMTSPDGITWTSRTAASALSWDEVCWSPELSLFCAVASTTSTTNIMTSPDGITWTTRTSAFSANLRGVCWSPELSLFCAVGDLNLGETSPDGITWTSRTMPGIGTQAWNAVCWSPELSLFCSVGRLNLTSDYGDRIATSPDGITWTIRPSYDSNYFESICWSPELSLFCAVSRHADDYATVFTSANGLAWSKVRESLAYSFYGVCWSPTLLKFCVVSNQTNYDNILISSYGTI